MNSIDPLHEEAKPDTAIRQKTCFPVNSREGNDIKYEAFKALERYF